ncbi:unnamed protein product [Adineta steineri]|uniref:NAD(P)(+)--arginine ADP-ribosyltransferase n=2 Tax=Adineta steineri TaxID=433720 RepID=A0A814DFV3_9BILA|nr:unnamed protein product [Adineta steineri]
MTNNNNYQYYPLESEELDAPIPTTCHSNTNNTLIWLDEDALNSTSPNTQLTIEMFKSIADTDYELYNSSEMFLAVIKSMAKISKLIVITSGCFAEDLLPKLSLPLLRELSSIFIFCKDSTKYQYLLKKCRKVIDICTDEQSLKEAIKDELRPSTDFLVMDRDLKPLFSLTDNSQEFNLYKKYIEVLKYYPWSSDNRKKMLNECKKHYRNNSAQRRKIEEFKYSYTPETAIQWYTRDSFLFRLVNKALRSLDMEQINIFRPYIKDLCKQLEHLHKQNQSDIPLTIFRGHGNMAMDQFEKLKENIGALISFNGFLSATIDYNVAVIFAGSLLTEDKSVIYEIRTNYNLKNVVFADITQLSAMEDEKEFLFSLCSIFRIDGIINDDENQLSKIIMSAVDEDAVNIAEQIKIEIIQGEENHFFCCINQYCHKQYIIKAFAIIFLIMIMALGIIFGINIKLKDHALKLNNCVGSNCTTFSATTTVITTAPTDIESSAVTNLIKTASTTLDYGTTNPAVSTRIDCVPVGWNYKGDLIKNESSTTAFAVDDDLNVYIGHYYYKSLDKWSPHGILIKRLYAGEFNIGTALFFHSPSQYLYFCYIRNETLGVFKITKENLMPINVIENINPEPLMNVMILSSCKKLYVNSAGDIFVLDTFTRVLRKWSVNSSSPIIVADGNKTDLVGNPVPYPTDFAVDETNNIIYLLDTPYKRIFKYTNGSEIGITIVDGSPVQMFTSRLGVDIDPLAIAVDKTGYIILGEKDRITIWSSDGKFKGIAMQKYQDNRSTIVQNMSAGVLVFDRFGNLYVQMWSVGHIVRFNRTSSTCANDIL